MTKNEDYNEEGLIGEIKQVNYKLTWLQFICFFFIYFAVSIFLGGLISTFLLFIGFEDTELIEITTSYYYLIFDAIIFILILILYKYARNFIKKQLDFSVLKKGKTYIYVVLALVLTFIIQFFIIDIFSFEDGSETNNLLGVTTEKESIFEYIFMVLSIAIITPIKEELIFRGLIFRFFETKYNFWLGLIISSLIFGLLHIGYPVTAIIMGIIFAFSYKLTNSLVTPMIIHMLWNLYAVIGMIIYY